MDEKLKEKVDKLSNITHSAAVFSDALYIGLLIEELDQDLVFDGRDCHLVIKNVDHDWTVYYSNGLKKYLISTNEWLVNALAETFLKLKELFP